MADNYLEKKYEEYKARQYSGAKTGSSRKTAVIRKTRRVFVTGGAEGIGKALVKAFRSAGHRVAFCDPNEVAGKETALQTGTSFYPVDVSDRKALETCMQQVFNEWSDIDILINHVENRHFPLITGTSVEDFNQMLSANLRPVFIASRLLALHRQSQDSPNPFGRIVNICSSRYQKDKSDCGSHIALQGSICSLTHALAFSLAPWHITVNSISSDWTEAHDPEQLRLTNHTRHPWERIAQPEDIARMCLFLCQEENDFMNGEDL